MPTVIRNISLIILCLLALHLTGCVRHIHITLPQAGALPGGDSLMRAAYAFNWQQRDSMVWQQVQMGNVPRLHLRFHRIRVQHFDTASGKMVKGAYYVSPDYFSVGNETDFVRMPITPGMAQKIADSLQCFLPTRKMVDDIYKSADIKLKPVPLFAFRDSTPTMHHHHLIIEGQRSGRKGLIAGIKKDVVITSKLAQSEKSDRVAIYGWHQPGGKPIQPLYTGHVNWYVDYSHGIRLVYQKIRVEGKWMHYADVLKHPVYRYLLCDEAICDFLRYPY